MSDYNPKFEESSIVYLDANNLYGHAMNRPLPYKDFKWIDSISIDTMELISLPSIISPNVILQGNRQNQIPPQFSKSPYNKSSNSRTIYNME